MKIFFSFLLLLICFNYINANSCNFKAGKFYKYNDAVNCMKSVQFNSTIRDATLDTLLKVAPLYTFLDLAIDSPTPQLPIHIDIVSEMKKMQKESFENDFEFHSQLSNVWRQLRDAHTMYYMPGCYASVLFWQAIAPTSYKDSNGDQKIYVSIGTDYPKLVDAFVSNFNINATKYIGYEISKINGKNALDYFKNWSYNYLGDVKDPQTRFNTAMTQFTPTPGSIAWQFSSWQLRTAYGSLFPAQESISYELISPSGEKVSITIPWLSEVNGNYANDNDFKNACLAAPSSSNLREQLKDNKIRSNQHQAIQANLQKIRSHSKKIDNKFFQTYENFDMSEQRAETFELLAQSNHIAFYALSDGETAVMTLNTMAPGNTVFDYYVLEKTMQKGFTEAAKRGLHNLILDFSWNGGGDICFGRAVVAYLQSGAGSNWGPQEVPVSPLSTILTKKAVELDVATTVYSPGFYDDQNNNPIPNSQADALVPGHVEERVPGIPRNFSDLVHIGIGGCGERGYQFDLPLEYSAKDVLIVTHGFCGSTCAYVVSHLDLYDNVKSVVIGGFATEKTQNVLAFPGLQVLDNAPFFDQLIQLNYSVSYEPNNPTPSDPIPRQLPTTAAFRYCCRELLSPNAPNEKNRLPLEYTYLPGTYHYFPKTSKTATQPEYTWYDFLPFFNQ